MSHQPSALIWHCLFILFNLQHIAKSITSNLRETSISSFKDFEFEEIEKQAAHLDGKYAAVKKASKLLNLPVASEDGVTCSPSIIRISDIASVDQDVSRPQVLISGAIHGDERVGPLASIATGQLLVMAASCSIDKIERDCVELRDTYKVSDYEVDWMTFLAIRRDTYIIPAANCIGHTKHKRQDTGKVDPNRDYPYARNNNDCMKSYSAKVFSALMKTTIIQILVTFHGGMVAIGYEWGSKNHLKPNDKSPDDEANKVIANLLVSSAGGFAGHKPYHASRMNSIVYPVDGGMEDWFYAAGWDKEQLKSCSLDKDKGVSEAENRALVFLVETSDQKSPSPIHLGKRENILKYSATENGHVPRNVRLGLIAIDMIQPYICFTKIMTEAPKYSDAKVNDTIAANILYVDWYVGGASQVDDTFLAWHTPLPTNEKVYSKLDSTGTVKITDWTTYSEALLSKSLAKEWMSRSNNTTASMFPFISTDSLNGRGRWQGGFNVSNHAHYKTHIFPVFQNGTFFPAGEYWLVAWTRVDTVFARNTQGAPKIQPQSHYANIRTNSDWKKKGGSRQSVGRTYWPSDPVFIVVKEDQSYHIEAKNLDCAWWRWRTKDWNH